MNILLSGQGEMAKAVSATCASQGISCIQIQKGADYHSLWPPVVAIHFGSGRQLPELLDICENMRIPLIQGSTHLIAPIPSNRNIAIINSPNLSIAMIRFMVAFPAFAEAIKKGMGMRITESHHEGKQGISGTALAVANTLGIPESTIWSITDPALQVPRGIPHEHLRGHAYHDFTFSDLSDQGVEIVVSTKINGRKTYAEGALTIARKLASLEKPLKSGVYGPEDILHLLATK